MVSSKEKQGVVINSKDVEKKEVEGADSIDIQWLISEEQGSENIYMRKFTIKPGGSMVYHKHSNTEHVQYVLQGTIDVLMDGEEYKFDKGDAIFIPKNTPHSYENNGKIDAVFLCMIPSGETQTERVRE